MQQVLQSMGDAALAGKGYNPHFMERPLLFQELNEAGDLPVELHNHPTEKPQAGQGAVTQEGNLLRNTRLRRQDEMRPRTVERASKKGPEARCPRRATDSFS